MKDLHPILRSLGLVESEIKTYLAALENGPSTVLDLAKLASLSRQASYTAIESLTKRGLMSNALHLKKRLYAAEDPQRLLDYAHRRENEMREFIGELQRLVPELELRAGGERPSVKVYEGKAGILAIVEDMKNSRPKESLEVTDLNAMYQVVSPEDLKPMRQLMKKIGMRSRSLLAGTTKNSGIVQADRRLLPPALSNFKGHLSVYGDKIALITFVGKMQSVIIESPSLARMMRIVFDLAFQASGKFSKA